MVAKDRFTDLEEALARLVHASYPPDAPAGGLASDRSADARISQSFAAATLSDADLTPPIPREPRSLGNQDTLARVAIAVFVGAFAIAAFRSYGGHATDTMANWVPPPATMATNEAGAPSAERGQIETMSDLAALHQSVEELAAGQEQLTREIARLHAEKSDKRMLRRASPHPALAVAAPTQKPARQ